MSDNITPHGSASSSSDSYKMVVYRSEDFHEVRSFDLSLSNLYIMSSVVMLVLCGLIYSLIAFTPIKRLIPGYGKLESNRQFLQMIDAVDDLGTKIDAQGTYIKAFGTMISTGTSDTPLKDLPALARGGYHAHHSAAQPESTSTTELVPNAKAAQVSPEAGETLYRALSNATIILPIEGIISSEYDPAIKHYGVDIVAPADSPVVSLMDGIVFSSGWDLETGYSIGIQHKDDILTFYKHNSQLLKEKGSYVKAGEVIAIIGNTGSESSGPHLHFELWHDGKSINPQKILNL